MRYGRSTFYACAAMVAQVAAMVLLYLILSPAMADAHSVPTGARAVSLSDARTAPTVLRYVPTGGTYTTRRARPCKGKGARGYFSDVSAYRWNGAPLGAQEWDEHEGMYAWAGGRGAVGYDGRTFYNGTGAPVLVAGWCG